MCLMSLLLYFVSEVKEAFPSDNEEFFDFSTNVLSPKMEYVPVGSLCGFSGPCKLEPDSPELGSMCFDSEGTSQVFGCFFL